MAYRRNGVPRWSDPVQVPKALLDCTDQCAGCLERYFLDSLYVADTPKGEKSFCSTACFDGLAKRDI